MSIEDQVIVTLAPNGDIKDITVGGHTIARACAEAELNIRYGQLTHVVVMMPVDKLIPAGEPPADWKPEDGQIGEWIRRNPESFRNWLKRESRIQGTPSAQHST
jgi:hypothetical protein